MIICHSVRNSSPVSVGEQQRKAIPLQIQLDLTEHGRSSPKKNGIMKPGLITSWRGTTRRLKEGSLVQTNSLADQMNFLFALAIRKSKPFLTLRLLNLNR